MRIERYYITRRSDATYIHMAQAHNGIGIGLLSIAILIISWYFGPYGFMPKLPIGFYWIITSFFLLVTIAALVSIFYKEKYELTSKEVKWTSSFGNKYRLDYSGKLNGRLKIATKQARRAARVYPYELILLDQEGGETPIQFLFQAEKNVKKFVQELAESVSFQVVEVIEEDAFRRRKLEGWFQISDKEA